MLVALVDWPASRPGAMDTALPKALACQILAHPDGFPWVIQDIGLLGLRMDDSREYRMHVWDPAFADVEAPIHDHPFDFVSFVIAGEMTNTRYVEDPAGTEYGRARYPPGNEDARTTDTVRLSAMAAETYSQGAHYVQLAHELHDSHQLPGTVTIIRRAHKDVRELTVCRRDGRWVPGRSRPATAEEVTRITAKALSWF